MELNLFHFTHPSWLLASLIMVLVGMLYFFTDQKKYLNPKLTQLIDSHLLPFLLVNRNEGTYASWKRFGLWAAVWMLLVLALAGPRWSFREIEMFSKDQSLVILLDLSKSMNAADVKPTRLIRAKQKITDLVSLSNGVKVGLVAFAADPHLITPITDDKKNVLHLLSSLDTDLIYIQGSKLSPALEMADGMLEAERGKNKAIVVISDGGFEDGSAIATAKKLGDKGIVIHAMGMGTEQGAPLKDAQGNVIKKSGVPVLTKLERESFKEIALHGKGRYLEPDYTDSEVTSILEELAKKANAEKQSGKERIWDEHFYFFLLLALPVILNWFRKEHFFAGILFFFTSFSSLEAGFIEYFKNTEELGLQAFEAEDFVTAEQVFQDSYHKGIACYRAGKFVEAETHFREANRPEVACSSAYNMGNALVKQNKLKEALTAYEEVVEKWPEHIKAQENLELVKKMLQEEEPPPQEQDKNKDKNKDKKDQKDNKNQDKKKDQTDRQDQQDKPEDRSKDKEKPPESSNNKDREDREDRENQEDKKEDKNEPKQEEEDPHDAMKQSAEEAEKKENVDSAKNTHPCKEADQQMEKQRQENDANCWLNKLDNDPKPFMKNKFLIETRKNGTKEGINPW